MVEPVLGVRVMIPERRGEGVRVPVPAGKSPFRLRGLPVDRCHESALVIGIVERRAPGVMEALARVRVPSCKAEEITIGPLTILPRAARERQRGDPGRGLVLLVPGVVIRERREAARILVIEREAPAVRRIPVSVGRIATESAKEQVGPAVAFLHARIRDRIETAARLGIERQEPMRGIVAIAVVTRETTSRPEGLGLVASVVVVKRKDAECLVRTLEVPPEDREKRALAEVILGHQRQDGETVVRKPEFRKEAEEVMVFDDREEPPFVRALEMSERPDEIERAILITHKRPQVDPVLIRPTCCRRTEQRRKQRNNHQFFHGLTSSFSASLLYQALSLALNSRRVSVADQDLTRSVRSSICIVTLRRGTNGA